MGRRLGGSSMSGCRQDMSDATMGLVRTRRFCGARGSRPNGYALDCWRDRRKEEGRVSFVAALVYLLKKPGQRATASSKAKSYFASVSIQVCLVKMFARVHAGHMRK